VVRADDFAGLDPDEAGELEALARELRRDRYQPEDERFWDILHGRIMGEVEVTPLPARPQGRWRRLWEGAVGQLDRAFGRGPGAARRRYVALAVGLVALAVLALVWPRGSTPVDELPAPAPLVERGAPQLARRPPTETVHALDLPDEIWDDGFLANRALVIDEAVAEEWLASPEIDGDAWLDVAAPAGTPLWMLEEMSDDELLELEHMLGG
jgi:hypothetical protein